MTARTATLHDGSTIEVVVAGDGPVVLMPIRTARHDTATAETMRAWGAEPNAGPTIVAGLRDAGFRVVAANLEGHRMEHPAPDTLTPEAITQDLLAIADAADVARFAYAGYSWLAVCGLQLAIRSDRLWALIMGGFPPIDGPYLEMLAVTRAAHAFSLAPAPTTPISEVEPGDWDSAAVQTNASQTRQFVTLYEALQGFDDAKAARELTIPALAYAGADDEITYGPDWGDVTVRLAPPLREHQAELEAEGWNVRLFPGRDHISTMHSDVVLPLLTSWLRTVAGASGI